MIYRSRAGLKKKTRLCAWFSIWNEFEKVNRSKQLKNQATSFQNYYCTRFRIWVFLVGWRIFLGELRETWSDLLFKWEENACTICLNLNSRKNSFPLWVSSSDYTTQRTYITISTSHRWGKRFPRDSKPPVVSVVTKLSE